VRHAHGRSQLKEAYHESDCVGGIVDCWSSHNLMKSVPGSRLLPDNFFNVPQNIVVPMDKPEILASINAFIDDLRTSRFLHDAVARSGVVGIEAAPKSPGNSVSNRRLIT
jgi:hypothetical protein